MRTETYARLKASEGLLLFRSALLVKLVLLGVFVGLGMVATAAKSAGFAKLLLVGGALAGLIPWVMGFLGLRLFAVHVPASTGARTPAWLAMASMVAALLAEIVALVLVFKLMAHFRFKTYHTLEWVQPLGTTIALVGTVVLFAGFTRLARFLERPDLAQSSVVLAVVLGAVGGAANVVLSIKAVQKALGGKGVLALSVVALVVIIPAVLFVLNLIKQLAVELASEPSPNQPEPDADGAWVIPE